MKLANSLRILLTVAFVVGILSSTNAGQKGFVVSPDTGGAKVEPDANKVAPEKVVPGKEDQKAATNGIKVAPGEPKSEPKVLPSVPKVVPKKVKPGAVKMVPKSSKSGKEMQKVTPGGPKVVPGGGNTGGFVPLKVEKKQEAEITVKCYGMIPTIVGTSGDDTLYGTQEADVIHGLGGNDKINGLGGNDLICGGDGNDEIEGAGGNDKLFGGDGNDTLWGSDGDDKLYGGDGDDKLYGGDGDDELRSGDGDDNLDGGPDNDTCVQICLSSSYVGTTINCEIIDDTRQKGEIEIAPKGLKKVLFPKIDGVFAEPNPMGEGGMSRVSPLGKIYIKGSGFGAQKGEIRYKFKQFSHLFADSKVTWESETHVNAEFPWITGKKDQEIEIWLRTKDGLFSNKVKFFFLATRETKTLKSDDPAVKLVSCGQDANRNVCNDLRWDNSDGSADWFKGVFCTGTDYTFCGGHRNARAAIGYDEGTDKFKVVLKNGWVVASGYYIYKYLTSSNEELSGPTPPPNGEAIWSPEFKWVVSPDDEVDYSYKVVIRGPKGIPYY